MDILDEAMLRLEALKEEKGDLAGVFCYIDNMTFVDGKREAEVLRTVKHIVMQQIVYEYVELKGYVEDPEEGWIKEGVDDMNGFELMSESYRKAAEQGKITRATADKKCRIYDFLATCDQEDICSMFDSAAFNEIAKSYMRRAVKELTDEGTIDEEQAKAVRNRYSLLFDEIQADEVI